MNVLKKVPRVAVAVFAGIVVTYIIVTLIGHFCTVSRINEQKDEIQRRQERLFDE